MKYLICALMVTVNASADDTKHLPEKCKEIIQAKLTNNVEGVLEHYVPQASSNPKYTKIVKKQMFRLYEHVLRRGDVKSIVVTGDEPMDLKERDKRSYGINVTQMHNVYIDVEHEKLDKPLGYFCQFAFDADNKKWYGINF